MMQDFQDNNGNRSVRSFLLYFLVIALIIIVLFPFYWLIISSLKPDDQLLNPVPKFIPSPFTVRHYVSLFRDSRFGTYLLNSMAVSIAAMLVSTAISTLAAYSIARLKYRGSGLLAKLILFTYMFPGVLLMVPLYNLLAKVHLLDTLTGLTIVYITWCAPFSTWVLISFFQTIPRDLEQAAMVDGTSRLGALRYVILPIATPGIITAMIFSFVSAWNEYPLAAVIMLSEGRKTLPVGLAAWITMYTVEWGNVTAGAVITALPVVLLFAILGQRFVAGLAEGAVKG